jgi:replicative DNA helicase
MNDFERILISSLSHQPPLLSAVSSIVSPEHFESPEAADIYAQMLTRQAFDPSTVVKLVKPETINKLGGVAGLCEVMAFAPSRDPLMVAQAIRADWERRRAAAIFDYAHRRLDNREVTPLDALNEVLDKISRIASPSSHVVSAQEAELALQEYEESVYSKDAPGLGIDALDRIIGGVRPGRLHIVAAYPGGGKTTMMVQTALRMAKHGRVVFVSGEMTASQIVAVAVSNLGQVDMSPEAIRRRKMNQDADGVVRVKAGLEALKTMQLYIVDHKAPSLADLNLYCQQYKPMLLVCDYLQIMKSPENAQNREQEVARNAQGLKSIAMEHQCAVMTGSQLNRDGQTRESDAPFHHCDVFMRIEPQNDANGSVDLSVKINVLKNRGGITRSVEALFRRHLATFAALK